MAKALREALERLDKEEAFQAWLDAGQPAFSGTVLTWYRSMNHDN